MQVAIVLAEQDMTKDLLVIQKIFMETKEKIRSKSLLWTLCGTHGIRNKVSASNRYRKKDEQCTFSILK